MATSHGALLALPLGKELLQRMKCLTYMLTDAPAPTPSPSQRGVCRQLLPPQLHQQLFEEHQDYNVLLADPILSCR